MLGINAEVTYYGKEKQADSAGLAMEYHKEFTTKDYPGDNWKENLPKELGRILDEFEGIKEIRFFVGKKIEGKPKEKEK